MYRKHKVPWAPCCVSKLKSLRSQADTQASVIWLCKEIILFVRRGFVSQAYGSLRKPFEPQFGTIKKELMRLGDTVREETSLAAKQQQIQDSIEAAKDRKENSIHRQVELTFRKKMASRLEDMKKWRQREVKAKSLDLYSRCNHKIALTQARRKGSSSWIFETIEYQRWKSLITSATLLCSGIIGAGKTVLCANVVEDFVNTQAAGSSVAYFFCRHDDISSLKAREIVGSLARQFLDLLPEDTFDQSDLSPQDVTLDTHQIAQRMLLHFPINNQYIILLDGLDECEHEEAERLITVCRTLLQSTKHIFKIFWSVRSDFVARLCQTIPSDFRLQMNLPSSGPDSFYDSPDIRNFIELELSDVLESGRLKLGDPRIIVQIQDALEAGAQGM